jgi:probable H4MPT-linked C1 transfer pathway protein
MSVVIGWDVGGAHLKAARAEGGRIVAAIQIASPLWLGVSRLDEAFRTARSELGSADGHAVTMTGELSMAFTSRSEGVVALAALTASALAPAPLRFYAGRAGFLSLEAVGAHASDVASANWHASAALIARCCREALLIDMGSTTTDIIPIVAGAVAARGYTDAERLATGELAYAGLVRSLAFASASRVPFLLKRSSHLASRHPLALSIIRRSDYFRKGGVGESRPREHVAVET